MTQTTKPPPDCYGKHFDRSEPTCVGGHDPAYTDDDGRHVRESCAMASSCAARCQANRQLAPQIVPATNLINNRPQAPLTSFSQPTQAAQPYRPAAYTNPSIQYHQPTPSQYHPQAGVQQMVPVNYGIPQYLSVREPVNGQSLPKRLGMEVLRSLGKAVGHTIAHFFDVEAVGRRD